MSPRHYAANYMAAADKEGQKRALNGCPEDWRELVKRHIWIAKVRGA